MSNEELVKLIQSGVNQRDNMQRLYEQNIGFINSLIKQYSYACHSYNRHARKLNKIDNETSPIGVIEYNELLQEAFIGLCNAVKGYDESMDCRFLTYSAYWIRQAIKRFLENCGNTIRVPVWLQARINYYNRIQSHYMSKYGRKATIEEIADIMVYQKK
jgi:RNA polymerase primary sigma factor